MDDDLLSTRQILPFEFPTDPLPLPSEPDWPRVHGYELLSVIGTGGMGIVYKAWHRALQRTVALKMLQGAALSDAEFRHRFYAEAETVARLQHPNIIQVFEIGTAEPRPGARPSPFIALEYVDGGSLDARAHTPQSPKYAAGIVVKLARAVAAAHRLAVVHRDLKPANVLLTRDGEPKVADFGVAKQLGVERMVGGRFVTQAGIVLGTPEYMAPEQVMGEPTTPAIDIYALGVILYELLTARMPFQAATPEQTMRLVRYQEPVSPRQLQPALPRDLETICLKCLEKVPGKRYESAAALADDLERWAKGLSIHARPVSALGRTIRWARRNPAVAGLSVAVVLVALAGLFGIVWNWREARLHAAETETAANQARIAARAERWERYRANIVAASSALQLNNVGSARQALETAPEEHRNWEWQHFQQQVDMADYILRWPDAVVGRAAITPDGAFVALLNADNSVRVWDVLGRKEVRTIPSNNALAHMSISADGQTLIYPEPNAVYAFRNLATDEVHRVQDREKKIVATCFNRDASRMAALAPDGTWRVWDTTTGKPIADSVQDQTALQSMKLTGESREVDGGGRREVRVWDVATGRSSTLVGHEQALMSVYFNPRGDRILTVECYPSNTIRLWDADSEKLLAVFRGHGNGVRSVAFSPDNTRIASSAMDQTTRIWDAASGQLLATLQGHKGWVNRVVFSPDGQRLATASQDHTVRLWDSTTGTPLAVLRGHTEEVHDVAYAAGGSLIVSAARDGTVRVWDARMVERNGILRGHTSFVYGVAFHPDGQRVASAGWDGSVRVWDATTGRQLSQLPHGDKTIVSALAMHPGGRLLATIARDDTVRLWDLHTGTAVQQWSVPTSDWRDTRVAFSRQGDLLAAGSKDGGVRLWSVNLRVEVAVLRGHTGFVHDVAFSPDGRWLASGGDYEERAIRIWDVARQTEVQVLKGHKFAVYALAFRDDGKILASGSTDGTVRLWDTATWRELAVLKHGANVYGVAFTPDGTRLASACADNTIRLWDVGTYQEVAELRGHEAYVHSIAFSPDGTRLVSASGDFSARIWDTLPPQERSGLRP